MIPSPPQFEPLFKYVMIELANFQIDALESSCDVGVDYRVIGPTGSDFRLQVKEYKRITPATAESACLTLKRQAEATGSQAILFAPVVSDRSADIATKNGVSWMDYAGNCRIVFPAYGIYVRRSGIENLFGKQLPKVLNVFSSKSSRVVRAMLHQPLRGWQLNALASHSDVRISPGLMSRIKRSLIEGGYAVMRDGLLHLKRPKDLLDDWANHYRNHKPKEYSFYVRGELESIEHQIAQWCSKSASQFALSRFSAAWRLAPEVRFRVVSFMVPRRAILAEPFNDLVSNYGARTVDSGANLVLQISNDESYFSNRLGETFPTTSPLQTYLDLKAMDGRGEDAAVAIYEKYFEQPFMEATKKTAEQYEGN